MKFREKTPPLTQQTALPPVSAAAAREEHAQLEAIKSGDEEASPSQEGSSKYFINQYIHNRLNHHHITLPQIKTS